MALKHLKDAGSGARVTYGEVVVKGRVYALGTVTRGGQRWRFSAPTKGEVEEKVAAKLAELANDGTAGVDMTGQARRDAKRARVLLGEGEELADAVRELVDCRRLLGMVDADGAPTGGTVAELRDAVKVAVAELALARAALGGRATMQEAAEFWAKHHPNGAAVTLGRLVDDFLAEQGRKGNSAAHRRILAQRCASLAEAFGAGRTIVSFTSPELAAFIDGREGLKTAASRNAWTVTMRSLFKFAAKRYGLEMDPARDLAMGKVVRAAPEFLGVESVRRLLAAAEAVAERRGGWAAAATAILFFAGVRPVELVGQYGLKGEGRKILGGLRWRDLKLSAGVVRLGADVTKTAQTRLVPISRNLAAWLERYGRGEDADGRIVPNPTAWRRAREAVEREAGVGWGQDYARHSFATYHFAAYGDRNALEAAMGHGESSTELERHYRGLATAAAAAAYWGIVPAAEAAAGSAVGA